MRAARYVRMSTEDQKDSPERQRATTDQAISKEGFRLYREYIDEARRGWDDTRPAFRQMLADAQAKKFDIVLVDECSRLSRDIPIEFFVDVAGPMYKAGVRLYSVAEGGFQDWTNLVGFMMGAVHQDRSAGESKKTAWRVTSDYMKFAAEGRIDLGRPPYGYKRVWLDQAGNVVHDGTHPPEHVRRMRAVPRLVPGDAEHVRTVQWIFDAYANRDMSLRDIGRELERRGVLTPAGNRVWSQNCAGKILREMKYAGYYVFNRVRQGRFCRLGAEKVEEATGFKTKSGMNPKDAWRIIANHHEPIVPVELFMRVQELLAGNRTRTTPVPNRGEFLLTKLVVCAGCGKPMAGHRNMSNGEAFYRCTTAMNTAQNHCHNNLVKEAEVVAGVVKALETKFLNPAFLQLLREEAERMEGEAKGTDRVARLRAELVTLEREIARARARLLKVDDETFDFLTKEIKARVARKEDVEQQLRESAAPTHKHHMEELIGRVKDALGNLRDAMQSKEPQRVSATLRSIVACVRVTVERRLVGKVKHRYFLTGADVMLRAGSGLNPVVPIGQRAGQGPADVDGFRVLSTAETERPAGKNAPARCECGGDKAGTTHADYCPKARCANLSTSEPNPGQATWSCTLCVPA